MHREWYFYGIFRVFFMVFLRYFYGIFVVFLWYFYGVFMVFLWYFRVFLWYFYGKRERPKALLDVFVHQKNNHTIHASN